jgi:hypothetical protein
MNVIIFEQLSVIYALATHVFVSSCTLVCCLSFPMRALERMEDEGDIIATAFYSSPNSLSNVPISRGDPTSLIIFNIFHAQVKLLPANTSPLLSMYNHYFF